MSIQFAYRKTHEHIYMKQQCYISFIYGSWFILLGGLIFYVVEGRYLQAVFWVFFIVLFLWLYVRNFPSLSRYLGYGLVADQPAKEVQHKSLLLYRTRMPFLSSR